LGSYITKTMTETKVRSRSMSPKRLSPEKHKITMEPILFSKLPEFVGLPFEVTKHMDAYSWCVGYTTSAREYLYIGLIEQLRRLADFTPELLSKSIKAVRFGKTPTSFGQSAFLTYLFEFENSEETFRLLYAAERQINIEQGSRYKQFYDFLACDSDCHTVSMRKTFIHEFKTMSDYPGQKSYMMFDLELPLPCVDSIDRKRWPSTFWTRVDEFRQRFGLPKGIEFPSMCDCAVCSPEQWFGKSKVN
jgi:hypothetical protein